MLVSSLHFDRFLFNLIGIKVVVSIFQYQIIWAILLANELVFVYSSLFTIQ